MTSWHIEQQDGKPYYMPQCEVCGLRYDEYGLYADKEQAAADAVDDGWQAWPDLYHTDWDCRCPQHWSVRCETCKRYVAQADRTEFKGWLFDRDDDDMRVGVCDQCLARMDTLPTLELGAWPIFHPSHQRIDKWQALKVLEEAAEVVEAARGSIRSVTVLDGRTLVNRARLVNEIADLLQTTTNLCAAFGITSVDLGFARTECIIKSLKRGMFDEGPRTRMHREPDDT